MFSILLIIKQKNDRFAKNLIDGIMLQMNIKKNEYFLKTFNYFYKVFNSMTEFDAFINNALIFSF